MKIAILYICTGKYHVFWKDFYLSCEKYLFIKDQKTYFVFTDNLELDFKDVENVDVIYQEKLGWPYDTLDRFKIFLKKRNELKKFDQIFFFNANSILVDFIDRNILNENEPLIGAQHPCYFDKSTDEFIYDRNPDSLAYMNPNQGNFYYMGAFNGGTSSEYVKMITELNNRIEEDKKNNIIALWHDESHLNRYFYEHQSLVNTLSPSFVYPEEMDIPYKKINVLRDKNKFGGHDFLRDKHNIKKRYKAVKEFVLKFQRLFYR